MTQKTFALDRTPTLSTLTGALSERAPTFVALLLGAALAVSVAHLVWTLRPSAAPPSPRGTGLPVSWMRLRARPQIERVLAAHLFGKPDAALAAGTSSAPSQLLLSGVFAVSGRPGEGYAILAQPRHTAQVYRAGAEVIPGGTLQAVYADRVVVMLDDGAYVLRLPRVASDRGVSAQINAAAADAAQGAQRSARQALSQPPPPATSTVAVLRSLSLQPARLQEGGVGMRVSGTNAQALQALGLNTGDVIVTLNGAPVGVAGAQHANLMQVLNSGQTANLTVERQGRLDDVTIDADTAAAALQTYQPADPSEDP